MDFILYDDKWIAEAIRRGSTSTGEISLNSPERILVYILKAGMVISYLIMCLLSRIPIVSSLVETFARTYSRNPIGFFLRGAYYKNKLKMMGKNVIIDMGVYISSPENVEIGYNSHIDSYIAIRGGEQEQGPVQIGKYVHIATGCILDGGGIKIGDYAAIAAGSCIYSISNYYEDPDHEDRELLSMSAIAPEDMQYVKIAPVVIDDYAFIGLNCTVLPGVTIGKASVIGAGSVVTGSIPPFSIAVGLPARVIKKRPLAPQKP